MLVFIVLVVEMGQQFDLCLGLDQKRLLRLDDLDRHIFSTFRILRPNDLTKGTFPDAFFDSIAPIEEFTTCDNVVIVLVVPSVIVSPSSWRSAGCMRGRAAPAPTATLGFSFGPGCPSSFSLFIVDCIDVFVGVDE